MTLPEAIAAPRASQLNAGSVQAEPAFLTSPEAQGLEQLGHVLSANSEIGAATGIELRVDGEMLAAAEPTRRGGGAAAVSGRVLDWHLPGAGFPSIPRHEDCSGGLRDSVRLHV
jgi:gamma-glutamyltranspeptidase/glutathione hydrolase